MLRGLLLYKNVIAATPINMLRVFKFIFMFLEREVYFLVLTENEKEAYLCDQETSRKINVIA